MDFQKIQKINVSLRPIINVIDSATYNLIIGEYFENVLLKIITVNFNNNL